MNQTNLSLPWIGYQEVRLRSSLLSWQSFGLDRSWRLLDEQRWDFLQKQWRKRFSEGQLDSAGLTDWLLDLLTFSSSNSRVWSWSTTLKTVRVSSAFSGRQRPGLHFWISATVLLMDWILCSTTCTHKKSIQIKKMMIKNNIIYFLNVCIAKWTVQNCTNCKKVPPCSLSH